MQRHLCPPRESCVLEPRARGVSRVQQQQPRPVRSGLTVIRLLPGRLRRRAWSAASVTVRLAPVGRLKRRLATPFWKRRSTR